MPPLTHCRLQLKANEVAQRKMGMLYTEGDEPGEFEDPLSPMFVDNETIEESVEDLTRPPGWHVGNVKVLKLQAIMREFEVRAWEEEEEDLLR